MIAWLAQNYATAHPFITIVGSVIALVFTIIIVYVNYRAYRRIKELEDI